MTKIMMQTNSMKWQVCPSMTTRKNKKPSQVGMKFAKNLTISKKWVCPSM